MQDTREQLSGLKKRLGLMVGERNSLEWRLVKSGPLLEGSLFEQYRKCGKSGCKCERGERHGPYPYLVVGKGKKRRLTYVAAKDYRETKKRSDRSKDFAAGLARLDQLGGDIAVNLNDIRRILESST